MYAWMQAFWDGLHAIGMGDLCTGTSVHNLATCLRSEQMVGPSSLTIHTET